MRDGNAGLSVLGVLAGFLVFDLFWIWALFSGGARADEEADALLDGLGRRGLDVPPRIEAEEWESP